MVEVGEVTVGVHSGGGGGRARPLGMGHGHPGHDIFLRVLNQDDEVLNTVCSSTDLFSGDQLPLSQIRTSCRMPPWILQGSCCPGDKIQHPRMLETSSQRPGRRQKMWMVPRRVARFGSRRTPAWACGSSQGAILQQQPWGGGSRSSASSTMARQVESGALKASMFQGAFLFIGD